MTKPTNYVSLVFKHWINLTLLAGVVLLGLATRWELAVLGLLVEAIILWIIPDLQEVKRSLDNEARMKKLETQRVYYVKTLWGVVPLGPNPFFAPSRISWGDVLFRVIHSDEVSNFIGLCKKVNELRDVPGGQPGSVSEDVLIRIEEMINGYLSLVLAANTASRTLNSINKLVLASEFEKLRRATEAADPNDRAFRVVLAERLRSIKTKADSLPRLERRVALARAQAENIVQSIEATVIQLRSQGAVEGSFTDTTLLVDMEAPVDELEVAAEVRGITSSSYELDVLDPTVWDDVAKKLGSATEPSKPVVKPLRSLTKAKSDRFVVDEPDL